MNVMNLGRSVCTGVLLACILSHPPTAMGNNGDYDLNGVVDQ